MPFNDPSGRRLRDWLGVNEDTFYNVDNFSITPIGFCFPGNDTSGGDLPPRIECAPLWQDKVTTALPGTQLTLLIGQYAQRRYLGQQAHKTLTETVAQWRDYGPNIIPMPHPSWRNNAWIKRHDWFDDLLTHLKVRVQDIITEASHRAP